MVKDKSAEQAIAAATHPINGFISNGADNSGENGHLNTSFHKDPSTGITVDVGSDDIQQNGTVLGSKEKKAQKKKGGKSLLNKFFRKSSTSTDLGDDSSVDSMLQNGVCGNGVVVNGYHGASSDDDLDDNIDNVKIETGKDCKRVVNRNGDIETVAVVTKCISKGNSDEHVTNRSPERRSSNGKLAASESKSLTSFQVEKTESGEKVAVLRGSKNTPSWRKEHAKTPADAPNIERAVKSRASAGDVLNKQTKRRSGLWNFLRSTRSKTNAADAVGEESKEISKSNKRMKRKSTDCSELWSESADNGSNRHGVTLDKRQSSNSSTQIKVDRISGVYTSHDAHTLKEDDQKTPMPQRPLPPVLEALERNASVKNQCRVNLDDMASYMDNSIEVIRPPLLIRRASEDTAANGQMSTCGINPPLLKKVHSDNNIITSTEDVANCKEASASNVGKHITNSSKKLSDTSFPDPDPPSMSPSRPIGAHCDTPDSSPATHVNTSNSAPTFASDVDNSGENQTFYIATTTDNILINSISRNSIADSHRDHNAEIMPADDVHVEGETADTHRHVSSSHIHPGANGASLELKQDLNKLKMDTNERDGNHMASVNKKDNSKEDKSSKRSKEKTRTPKGYNSLSRIKNDVVKIWRSKWGNDKDDDENDDNKADGKIRTGNKCNAIIAEDTRISNGGCSEKKERNAGVDDKTGADDNRTTYPITQVPPNQSYSILGDKNNNSSHAAAAQHTSRKSSNTLSTVTEQIQHKHIENARCMTPVRQFKVSCENDETNVTEGLQCTPTQKQVDIVLPSDGHRVSNRNDESQINKSDGTNGNHVSCIKICNTGNVSSNNIAYVHGKNLGEGETDEHKTRNNDTGNVTGVGDKPINTHNNENQTSVISVNTSSNIAIVTGNNNKSGRKKSKAPIAPNHVNNKAMTTGNSKHENNCDIPNHIHTNTSDKHSSVIAVTNKFDQNNTNINEQYSLNPDPHTSECVSPASKVTSAISSVSDQSSESEFTEVSSVDTSIYVGATSADSHTSRVVSSNNANHCMQKSSLVVLPVLHGGEANTYSVSLHPQTTSSDHLKISDSDSSTRNIGEQNSISAPQLLSTPPDHYESLEIDDGSWSSTDTGTQHTTSSGNKDLSSSTRSGSKSSSSLTRHGVDLRRSEEDLLNCQSLSIALMGGESDRIDQLHTPTIMKNSVSMSNLYGHSNMDTSSLKRNVRRMSSSSLDLEHSNDYRGQAKGKFFKIPTVIKNIFKSRPVPDITQQLQYEINLEEERLRSKGMEVPPNDDPRQRRANMLAAPPVIPNEETRSRFSMADSGIYQGYGSETPERYNAFANARNSKSWLSLTNVVALNAKASHEHGINRGRSSLAPCLAYQENSANISPKRPPRRRRKRSREPVLIPSRTELKKVSSSGNTGDSSSLSDVDRSGATTSEKPLRSKGNKSHKEIQDSDKFNSVSSAKTYASLGSFSSLAELEGELYERESRQRTRANHKAERSKNRSSHDMQERRPHSVGRSALLEKEFKVVQSISDTIPPAEHRRKRYENRHQQMERRRLSSTDDTASRHKRRSRNCNNGNILDPGVMPRLEEHVIADYSKALGRPLDERLIAETLWQKIYAQLLHDLDTENMEEEYRDARHRKAEDQDERRSKMDEGYSSVRSSRSSREEVELQHRLSADQSLENLAPQSYIGRNRYEPRQYDWRLSGTLRKERITPNLKANPQQEQLEEHGQQRWHDKKSYSAGGAESEPERRRLSSDRKGLGLENLKLNSSGYMWRPTPREDYFLRIYHWNNWLCYRASYFRATTALLPSRTQGDGGSKNISNVEMTNII